MAHAVRTAFAFLFLPDSVRLLAQPLLRGLRRGLRRGVAHRGVG